MLMLSDAFLYISSLALFLITTNESPLIWISVDGLGANMITMQNTPFLYKLSKKAVISSEHHPNYITKTFPNHFSAATGLNIEDHQIVGNYMNDPTLGRFYVSNNDPAWWNPNGDTYPIWTLNEMYSKRGSATIYWPGSSVPYGGKGKRILPKYHIPGYDHSCDCKCRLVDAYPKMISGEYELVMVYTDDVDSTGHIWGLETNAFIGVLKRVDSAIEQFFNKITGNKELSDWNLLISSDHGMLTLTKKKTLILDNILPRKISYNLIMEGSEGQLKLWNKSDKDTVVKLISKHIGVYMVVTPETMPERYKYSKSKRIPDITIILKEGWAVTQSGGTIDNMVRGDHGYPSDIAPSMFAVMMGFGKNFHKTKKIPKTVMTDLFGVACYILEIEEHCKIDPHAKSVAESMILRDGGASSPSGIETDGANEIELGVTDVANEIELGVTEDEILSSKSKSSSARWGSLIFSICILSVCIALICYLYYRYKKVRRF